MSENMTNDNKPDTIRHRLPSRGEAIHLFWVCAFFIHIWAYLMFFYRLQGYLYRLSLGTIVGIFAYSQLYAFLESIVSTGIVIFVCIALPRRSFKDKIIAQGTILIGITSIWMIVANFITYSWLSIIWITLYFIALFGVSMVMYKNQKIEDRIIDFAERTYLLSAFFIFVDMVSIVIVIIRLL
jgi:hypothetical protein